MAGPEVVQHDAAMFDVHRTLLHEPLPYRRRREGDRSAEHDGDLSHTWLSECTPVPGS